MWPFDRRPKPAPETDLAVDAEAAALPRMLFLDDNSDRAASFLSRFPHAVWVQTAEECLARLAEAWDEVHLDHDLCGERFVDPARDDCGMAVVRWICLDSRPHLADTRFTVHSHNTRAAAMMVMHLAFHGYDVVHHPFGATEPFPPEPPRPEEYLAPLSWFGGLRRRVLRLLGRESPEDFGYSSNDPTGRQAFPDPPILDFFEIVRTPRKVERPEPEPGDDAGPAPPG